MNKAIYLCPQDLEMKAARRSLWHDDDQQGTLWLN